MGAYRCYARNGLHFGACSYYRTILPLSTMEELGFPIEVIIDEDKSGVSPHIRGSLFLESDFNVIYQNINPVTVSMMKEAKKFKPLKSAETGEIRWPPTFIVDTDDDLFNVMPLNISYGSLGTRDHAGRDLKDGDEVGIAHPLEIAPPEAQDALNAKYTFPLPGTRGDLAGQRYIYDEDGKWHQYFSLWRDGQNFDIKSNRTALENWKQTVRLANLVTCSTAGSEAYIKREIGEDIPTFITPNAIDFREYPEIELREHPGEVRIMWEGGASHHEGLWPITKSIGRLADKYPQTTWHFFGAKYKWAAEHLPADRVKFVPWVQYAAYKHRLSTICHDICMAPLVPALFNQSRSAIRWYESSAIWRPAATVAQRTGAYTEIEDGVTGMLFDTPDQFEAKMSELIEDEMKRKTIAANAKDWVRTNRDHKDIATRLFMKYVEVREAQKRTMPAEDPDLAEIGGS